MRYLSYYFFSFALIMSTNNQPLQPSNSTLPPPQPPQNNAITLSLDQLLSALFLAQQQAFPTSTPPGQTDRIAREYCRIQLQIIEVVEMRKDMQKMIEMEALQSAHFHSLVPLIQQNIDLQTLADQSATTIKQLQSQQIEKSLNFYSDIIKSNDTRQARQNPIQFKCLLDDMKRELSKLPLGSGRRYIEGVEKSSQDSDESAERGSVQAHCIVKQEHEQRNALNKQIYRQLFQDLSLRQQLLVERQSVFQDYQASSHELVEALLRQREKENNLQRAEHEKHQHLLGVRHRFDIQLQKLTHHQSHLVSLYELDLINLKKHLHQVQDQLRQSQQLTKSLQEQLLASQQHSIQLRQQLEMNSQERNRLKITVAELETLQSQCSSLEEQLKSSTSSERRVADENILLQNTIKSLQRQSAKLAEEKRELAARNQELQSQLNESILRSSQSKKLKQELNRKLEDTQSQLLHQKQKYDQIKQNYQLQQSLLQQQSEQFSNKQSKLQQQIKDQENLKLEMESKINYLQNELTLAFIDHNRERKELTFQIETKDQSLVFFKQNHEMLTRQIEKLRAEQLTIEDWSSLKDQLAIQIKRQMQSATKAVDQFAERIHTYCQADS